MNDENTKEVVTRTIHEHHNAPAVEQARLLHDLEAEAEKRIVESARIGNKYVRGTVQTIRRPVTQDFLVRICFSLNDEDLTVEYTQDDSPIDLVVAMEHLYRGAAEAITRHLSDEIASTVTRRA